MIENRNRDPNADAEPSRAHIVSSEPAGPEDVKQHGI